MRYYCNLYDCGVVLGGCKIEPSGCITYSGGAQTVAKETKSIAAESRSVGNCRPKMLPSFECVGVMDLRICSRFWVRKAISPKPQKEKKKRNNEDDTLGRKRLTPSQCPDKAALESPEGRT